MRRKRCKTCSCKIVSLRGDSTCLATLLQEIDPSRGAQSLVQTQGSGVGVREYAFSFLMHPASRELASRLRQAKLKLKGKKERARTGKRAVPSCSCSRTEWLEHAISCFNPLDKQLGKGAKDIGVFRAIVLGGFRVRSGYLAISIAKYNETAS